ncbi:CPBP family intramembrane glutamic endopeptidase [Haloarchaeobius amylolyticus]|uniref:CPBP family intramembrane glutamic endopeptidase n=1 Tax=Haloarchaeobius amylolyticus TaxID=1198296 RepID=UPI00226FBE6B
MRNNVTVLATTLAIASLAVTLAMGVAEAVDTAVAAFDPLSEPILVDHVLDKMLVNFGVFTGVSLGYLQYRRSRGAGPLVRFRRPTWTDARFAIMGFFVVLGVGAVLHQTVAALDISTGENTLTAAAESDPRLYVVAAVTSILFVAPGEEILFRGVVQGRLREVFGPIAAVVLGGVVFAVPHLVAAYTGPGAVVSIGIVFGISLALGALYEYTGTLFVPIVAHGFYNVAILAIVALSAG